MLLHPCTNFCLAGWVGGVEMGFRSLHRRGARAACPHPVPQQSGESQRKKGGSREHESFLKGTQGNQYARGQGGGRGGGVGVVVVSAKGGFQKEK